MNWDISFAAVTVCILGILLVFYFTRPRFRTHLNAIYTSLLIFQVMTLVSNIVSSYMDSTYKLWPISILYITNAIYFFAFYTRGYVFFRFILAVTNKEKSGLWIRGIILVIYLFCLILVAGSPFVHTIFWIDSTGYHSGIFYYSLYVAMYIFLASSSYLLLSNIYNMVRQLQISLWISVGFIVMGTIIRKLFPQALAMDMFFMFAILILFLAIQNPDKYIDDRTNCFNARAFQLILRERLERKKYPKLHAFAICRYNDKREIYSSILTDLVLEEIGQFLKNEFPDIEKFYLRNGQFVLFLSPEVSSEYVHEILRERFNNVWNIKGARIFFNIRQVYMNPDLMEHNYIKVRDCIYATLDKCSSDPDNVGSDKFERIEQDSFDRITRMVQVRHILSTAIQENSVEAWLQPIVDAQTGQIVAAEALSRIRDKKLGLIPPAEFIALAEQNGMIGILSEQILANVCSYYADRGLFQKGVKWINVNLSPIQCLDTDLAEVISNIVDSYRIPHSCIHLEITEEAMVDEILLKKQMDALVSKGFVFALDDYGNGFSNIIRVKNLPFSNIKIDKQVVRDHFQNPDNILPATVKMFTERGQTVTAEGVETEEMAELLRDMGCTHLQGFFYSTPLPIEEFETLVK